MLESIISPKTAEKNPWDMIILAALVSTVAIWLGYYLAEHLGVSPSMLSLGITVMALAPLMHRVLLLEEDEEEKCRDSSMFGFISRHMDVVTMYSFLFVGLLASFAFWHVFLPAEAIDGPSCSSVFGLQEIAVGNVQKKVSSTGQAVGAKQADLPKEDPRQKTQDLRPHDLGRETEDRGPPTAAAVSAADRADLSQISHACYSTSAKVTEEQALSIWRGRFSKLYENNMWIVWIAFCASFLFGAGALWLLTWNASTIAVFIGAKIKIAIATGTSAVEAYATGFPMYSLSIALWAIPEVLAYLVAAIAGGIISAAVARHHYRTEKFWVTVLDALFFMLIAVALVIIGAYVEHFFVKVPCPNV